MDVSIWTLTFQESLTQTVEILLTYLPRAVGAVVLLAIGVIVARLVRAAARRVLMLVGAERLSESVGLRTALGQAGVTKSLSDLGGSVAYAVMLLLFVIGAVQTLGLTTISEALGGVVSYLPSLALALLVGLAGLVVATFVRDLVAGTCRAAQVPHGDLMAQAAYVVAVLVAAIMAITELGVDTSLLSMVIILLVAGATGAMALSLGFGGRSTVANVLAAYSLRSVLGVGQELQVGEISGTVSAITATAVILESEGRTIVLPAAQVGAAVSVVRAAP